MRLTVLVIAAMSSIPVQADWTEQCGLNALIDRIGAENVPDGDGIVTCIVEVMVNTSYMPDTTHADLGDTMFFRRSGTVSGHSSHATIVARRMAGVPSFTPNVWAVNVFETSDWLGNGWLHTNQGGVMPDSLAGLNSPKVWNLSWVSTYGNVNTDKNALRRLDWTIVRDDTLVVGGVNNGDSPYPLPSYAFNTLMVGIDTGNHAWGTVPSGYDGEGRRKPEIITPNGQVSFSVPWVTSAGLLLVDYVRDTAGFPSEGERVEVLKALLLSGATHDPHWGSLTPWTNNPGTGADRGFTRQPLDDVVGAGTLNINIAHLMLEGSLNPGGTRLDEATSPPLNAWSLEELLQGETRFWRFDLDGDVEALTATAVWHRGVGDSFASWSIADLELELFGMSEDGLSLVSLRGTDGEAIFADGNIACDSEVDNLEHLHALDLAEGTYVLRLRRHASDNHEGTIPVGIAWTISDPVDATPSDFDDSGDTSTADLLMLLEAWGPCNDCLEDIDDSGAVDAADLSLLVDDWG